MCVKRQRVDSFCEMLKNKRGCTISCDSIRTCHVELVEMLRDASKQVLRQAQDDNSIFMIQER
jgi:hypothetical protein